LSYAAGVIDSYVIHCVADSRNERCCYAQVKMELICHSLLLNSDSVSPLCGGVTPKKF